MAAPLGWKDFAAGDTLTAGDMDGYVMAQVIAVFTNAAARDSAITSPQEGQHCFLTASNDFLFYNGSAWEASPVGDITGITTATNSSMAGGATSGTASISVDVHNSTAVTAVATDYVLISDTSGSNATKKALISDITALAGDITGVTAGTALSGGGSSGAVTLNADVNGASAVTAVSTDYVLIADTSDSNNTKKALVSDIVSLVPPSDPIPLILALS